MDWSQAERGWRRLTLWVGGDHAAPDGGGPAHSAALDALTDIGDLRRSLDEAELAAVRQARTSGVSWAEIATRLGITRQAAWERWRDLDSDPSAPQTSNPSPAAGARGRAPRRIRYDSGDPAALTGGTRVPDVVGSVWTRARLLLSEFGLAAADPDTGQPWGQDAGDEEIVLHQVPAPGTRVRVGSSVTLWFRRGGGAGVREPRRPLPRNLTGHGEPAG